LRATFFLALALLLMVFDHCNSSFNKFRSSLSVIVVPLQYVVAEPIRLVNLVVSDFSTQQQLAQKNARLNAELVLLQAKLQKQGAIEMENKWLHSLLQSAAQTNDKVAEAQLLAISPNPFIKQIVLDKGSKDDVYVGQPVLDVYGVIGQVIQVGYFTSRVMLVTDSQSSIPVQIKRNGIRAITKGQGSSDLLKLQNVPDTVDVKKGDLLITSGLGRLYPFGCPVGRVVTVAHNPGESFADITVEPVARLDRDRLVLLVWHKDKENAGEVSVMLKDMQRSAKGDKA
jgi:rod shape-determining protein MreC